MNPLCPSSTMPETKSVREETEGSPQDMYWRSFKAHLPRLQWSSTMGRMPMSKDLPFKWYDTPNLHHSSIPDLEPLFGALGMVIDSRVALDATGRAHPLGNVAANLLASSSLYVLHARR